MGTMMQEWCDTDEQLLHLRMLSIYALLRDKGKCNLPILLQELMLCAGSLLCCVKTCITVAEKTKVDIFYHKKERNGMYWPVSMIEQVFK